jgi:hypothetical protein
MKALNFIEGLTIVIVAKIAKRLIIEMLPLAEISSEISSLFLQINLNQNFQAKI